MMKVLSKSERDFLVCSDCIYFDFVELIDERYPLKRGRCSLHNKIVDDRWETLCEDCTGKYQCTECCWCEESIEEPWHDECLKCGKQIDEDNKDEVCEFYQER